MILIERKSKTHSQVLGRELTWERKGWLLLLMLGSGSPVKIVPFCLGPQLAQRGRGIGHVRTFPTLQA